MNQKQRDFLSEAVNKNIRARRDELKSKLLPKPSLNNYLVSAVLTGTVVYQSHEVLAQRVKERVLALSDSAVLVGDSDRNQWGRRNNNKESLVIEPDAIFVLPEDYLKALSEWHEHNDAVYAAIDKLDSYKAKVDLKIQVGSDAALQSVIDEADSLTSLSLVESVIEDMPKLSAKTNRLLNK